MVDGGAGGGWDTGCPIGGRKKQPLWKYLENCSIFFPDCFWSPQKSFEDIFFGIFQIGKIEKFSIQKFRTLFFKEKSRSKNSSFSDISQKKILDILSCLFWVPTEEFWFHHREDFKLEKSDNFPITNFDLNFLRKILVEKTWLSEISQKLLNLCSWLYFSPRET